jgi:hypothetical protein
MSKVSTQIRFIAAVPQFAVSDLVRTAEHYRDVLGDLVAEKNQRARSPQKRPENGHCLSGRLRF